MATFLDATLGGQTFTTPKPGQGLLVPGSLNFLDVPLANPSINTVAGNSVVIGSGVPLTDTAHLSGGFNPTGTITFTLYNPSNVAVYTDVVTVSGARDVHYGHGHQSGRLPADAHGDLPLVGSLTVATRTTVALRTTGSAMRQRLVAPFASPSLITTASFRVGGGAWKFGRFVGRVQRDWYDHVHADCTGQHGGRHRDGDAQR